ncbi:transporter [Kockovaella imperatae]|uniref:Transporter n=1 Tax=Kockovaella imperatae TaxID=4999 RepID=A0A1Y1UHA8_9TREE|nr:transporter [Kockovaella imperatae]ORX37438.1 transporter [Kockovaella imperatae]
MAENQRAIDARATEATPLLQNGKDGQNQHYNLAGLSQTTFWILCLSMWIAAFLVAFDGTVVAALIGPISSSFNATNEASWLGTSYLLAVCCVSPIYGRLCNVIGRQASMLIAVVVFAIGNILCAVAPTMNILIAARFIAGLGGGGLQVTSSTITSDIVPLSYRGLFQVSVLCCLTVPRLILSLQGYANITFGIGTGLGAPIGGFVNDWLGWRWAFWLQAPTFVVAFIAVFFFVRYDVPSSKRATQTPLEMLKRIDFAGCLLLFGWLGCAILVLSMKTEATDDSLSWTSPRILGLIITSVILFLVFLVVEFKLVKEPVLPIDLLGRRTPIACFVNNFFISIVIFGTLYTVPLYFSAVLQMSSTETGLRFMPAPLIGICTSIGVGYLVKVYGKYKWLCFLGGLDGILGAFLITLWRIDSPNWQTWTFWQVSAPSGSAVTTLTVVALIADVGREGIAMATSLSYVARMTGQVVGVSMSGAVIQTVLARDLPRRITGPGSIEIISSIRKSSAAIKELSTDLQFAARMSYQKATHTVFVIQVVMCVLYTLAGLGIEEVDMKAINETAPPSRDEEAEQGLPSSDGPFNGRQ